MDSKQKQFDFDSKFDARVDQIERLENCWDIKLTRGRLRGVVELLCRLMVLMKTSGSSSVKAPRINLAAGIRSRKKVSERTISNWARDAEELGLVERVVMSQEFGGNEWNLWVIRWHKIDSLVGPPVRVQETVDRVFERSPPDDDLAGKGLKGLETISTPGLETVSTPSQSFSSGHEKPEPDRCADPEPGFDFEKLFSCFPELREWQSMAVKPLPVGRVRAGAVFEKISDRVLKNPTEIFRWFRSQSSLPDPILPADRLHLVFCLSAAKRAVSIRSSQITSSRVGVFAGIVKRRSWYRVLGYVPESISLVEKWAKLESLNVNATA